jgi:hypothetical protein
MITNLIIKDEVFKQTVFFKHGFIKVTMQGLQKRKCDFTNPLNDIQGGMDTELCYQMEAGRVVV